MSRKLWKLALNKVTSLAINPEELNILYHDFGRRYLSHIQIRKICSQPQNTLHIPVQGKCGSVCASDIINLGLLTSHLAYTRNHLNIDLFCLKNYSKTG